jgi:hypothetical protein
MSSGQEPSVRCLRPRRARRGLDGVRRLAPSLFLLVAACLGDGAGPTASPSTPAPSTTPPPSLSSTTASRPPTATSTTDAPTTTATTTTGPGGTPTLEDGRPVTFLAVTNDYEAVEVDTATGEILRSFGQRATAADLDTGEFPPNVVDALWRTTSGAMILVSECCEPAGGRINYLGRSGRLSDDHGEPNVAAWAVVPSPVSDAVILVGYATAITTPDPTAASDQLVFLENDGSGVGAIGWSADGRLVYWYDAFTGELVTWDPTASVGDVGRTPVDWVGDGQRLAGLEQRMDGALVSFLLTAGDDYFDIVATEMVVYRANDAEIIDRFGLDPGSVFGGFDPTGTHFVYTTRSGQVMWKGPEGLTPLADGFLFAGW